MKNHDASFVILMETHVKGDKPGKAKILILEGPR
jgi:hypothetical protein